MEGEELLQRADGHARFEGDGLDALPLQRPELAGHIDVEVPTSRLREAVVELPDELV